MIGPRGALVAVLLTAALLTSACKEQQAAGPPATPDVAKKLIPVRVNFAPSVSFAPLAIAKEEGYFAGEGLDVSLEKLEMNAAQLSMVTGKLDVFAGPVRPGFANLIARGETVAIVADKGYSAPGPCAPEAFVAPAEMADRIAKRGNVRGERFSTLRAGYSEYFVSRLLERQKLKKEDIEHTFLPSGGDFLDPKKNEIAAVRYVTEPNLTNALASGMKIVATGEEVAPGHQFAIIAYGKRLLQDDPELGHRFMRAYLKGVARYNEGKTNRNVAIISGYTKLPDDLIRRMCWQPIAGDGRVKPAMLDEFFRWGRSHGYVEGDIPPSRWWDPRFVDAAAAPPAG